MHIMITYSCFQFVDDPGIKPGSCPQTDMLPCASQSCDHDSNCQGTQKCCKVASCGFRCVEPIDIITERKHCYYKGVMYEVGETFEVNECTKCSCGKENHGDPQFGGAMCVIVDCPVLQCNKSDLIHVPGQCCSFCPEEYFASIINCPTKPIIMNLDEDKDYVVYHFTHDLMGDVGVEHKTDISMSPQEIIFSWFSNSKPHIITVNATMQDNERNMVDTCEIQLFVIGGFP